MKFRWMMSLLLAATATGASAQPWPQRAVTIVVPYTAGGNTDLIARIAATRLGAALNAPVVVDNKPGAAGLIAMRFVAAAPADGYTLLMGTASQLVTMPFISDKLPFDPSKTFEPIINIGANPFVLAINSQAPVKTLPEFVRYARSQPGKLTYGSAGVGGITHLSAYLFMKRADIDMLHIPYRGGSAALTDLLAGQIDMYSASPSEIIPHLNGGKLRLLGVSSLKRLKELPGVPTIAESYPGHEVLSWNGLLAPVGTPTAVLDRIAAEVAKMRNDLAVQKQLEDAGITPQYVARAAFRAQIQKELSTLGPVLKASGIKME